MTFVTHPLHGCCPAPQNMGLDVDSIILCQPDNGEMALEVVDQLVRSSAVDIIAIDSVAALVPRAEIEGEIGAVQGAPQTLPMLVHHPQNPGFKMEKSISGAGLRCTSCLGIGALSGTCRDVGRWHASVRPAHRCARRALLAAFWCMFGHSSHCVALQGLFARQHKPRCSLCSVLNAQRLLSAGTHHRCCIGSYACQVMTKAYRRPRFNQQNGPRGCPADMGRA